MEFVPIPPGTFMMGSPESEAGRQPNEGPQRQVTIGYPFGLGKYQVTQAQWQAVMGNNPSLFPGEPTRPVDQVSWDDAQAFISKLNAMEGVLLYRLPTEAQWEYAARAGATTVYSFGNDPKQLGDYAWYRGNSERRSHPVGQKRPNAWGLHDMLGNVWEWVQDCYDKASYAVAGAPTDGSAYEAPGCAARGVRVGSWFSGPARARVAYRGGYGPDSRFNLYGFRVARTRP